MIKTYLPYEPDQQLLLPAALQEWLPDDHLAYFISDVVDQLDMSKVTARYERERRGRKVPIPDRGDGHQAIPEAVEDADITVRKALEEKEGKGVAEDRDDRHQDQKQRQPNPSLIPSGSPE